jgi:hypothetical protein
MVLFCDVRDGSGEGVDCAGTAPVQPEASANKKTVHKKSITKRTAKRRSLTGGVHESGNPSILIVSNGFIHKKTFGCTRSTVSGPGTDTGDPGFSCDPHFL